MNIILQRAFVHDVKDILHDFKVRVFYYSLEFSTKKSTTSGPNKIILLCTFQKKIYRFLCFLF